nr:class I SAM-dependent methyltransferase [Longispora albida]
MSLADLLSPAGQDLLARAEALAGGDPLRAAAQLRTAGTPPELASEALTQAALRLKGRAKFGADADGMYFTRAGLEQATRASVSARRAARLAAAGVRSVADLGCGIGADSRAFARAGITVHAIEADPATAEIATANTAGLPVTVTCGDATEVDLSGYDAVFCDPARRSGNRRIFDPKAYSPPWDFIVSLTTRPAVIKLGPGIDHALLPATAEAEWVSVGGEVVEAALWCDRLAEVPRRATVDELQMTGAGDREAEVGEVGRYVYDPDGAVIRAHLVAELADELGARIADPTIAYLYADELRATPFARGYTVEEVLPFSLKRLRAALREREVGRLTIKKRGSALEPESLRRQLRLSGSQEATVILTRVAGAPVALITQPAPAA